MKPVISLYEEVYQGFYHEAHNHLVWTETDQRIKLDMVLDYINENLRAFFNCLTKGQVTESEVFYDTLLEGLTIFEIDENQSEILETAKTFVLRDLEFCRDYLGHMPIERPFFWEIFVKLVDELAADYAFVVKDYERPIVQAEASPA